MNEDALDGILIAACGFMLLLILVGGGKGAREGGNIPAQGRPQEVCKV